MTRPMPTCWGIPSAQSPQNLLQIGSEVYRFETPNGKLHPPRSMSRIRKPPAEHHHRMTSGRSFRANCIPCDRCHAPCIHESPAAILLPRGSWRIRDSDVSALKGLFYRRKMHAFGSLFQAFERHDPELSFVLSLDLSSNRRSAGAYLYPKVTWHRGIGPRPGQEALREPVRNQSAKDQRAHRFPSRSFHHLIQKPADWSVFSRILPGVNLGPERLAYQT